MITVKELRNMFLDCEENWTIDFRKWEHGTKEDFMKRNHYPAPNLVSIKIQKITFCYNNMGGKIYTVVMEDDFDSDFELDRNDMIKFFCDGKDDNDLINFVLYVENESGKYDYITLEISIGDKGYSDRIMIMSLDEMK